jgi:hypothetical protein
MPNDLIRYDLLVQEALCGVVKKVLGDVARHGLPGDHHFYITFRTHAPGVRLSARMRELYPEEMTIILQHQFEDLKVTDFALEVGLSFKGIPEILLIPFDALTGFFDPSVQFSAKFEPQPDLEEDGTSAVSVPPGTTLPGPRTTKLPAPAVTPLLAAVPQQGAKSGASGASKPARDITLAAEGEAGSVDQDKVVSIDAFRKKP